jgi:hypothetical protein
MAAAIDEDVVADLKGFDQMDVRALTECMTVLPHAPGLFRVVSGSGATYTVDAREGSCSCPDARYRDRECKHQRRVEYELGEREIPDWVQGDQIDELFQEFVKPAEAQR